MCGESGAFCSVLFVFIYFSCGRDLSVFGGWQETGTASLGMHGVETENVRERFLEEAGGKPGAPPPTGCLLPLSLQGEGWCAERSVSLASVYSMPWQLRDTLGKRGVG